jgi:hypothetical protein
VAAQTKQVFDTTVFEVLDQLVGNQIIHGVSGGEGLFNKVPIRLDNDR